MATQAEWRKAQGMSQAHMARVLSFVFKRTIHQSSISQWESGRNTPAVDVALAVHNWSGGEVDLASYKTRCPRA